MNKKYKFIIINNQTQANYTMSINSFLKYFIFIFLSICLFFVCVGVFRFIKPHAKQQQINNLLASQYNYKNIITNLYNEGVIDSSIFNFFNNIETYFNQYFFLDTSSNHIIESIDDDFKIKFFTNNYAIDSVIIIPNKEQLSKITLFNVQLSEYDNNNFEVPFNINKPNAFILDLRD